LIVYTHTTLPDGDLLQVISTLKHSMKSDKRNKSGFRQLIEWLHLWPSLVSAVIVIFVCITGTIIVYCDEIIDWANSEVLYVQKTEDERISEEKLYEIFMQNYPDRRAPGYMVTYRGSQRSIKFNSYDPDKGLRLVYMDPYTGQILKDDGTIHFFYITAHLHNSLLLGKPGEWIVDVSTIIFMIGLITGLVLWWPKKWNKTETKKSFSINWKAKFKRVNYDLHNVLGFYALSLTIVIAFTGLIIAFKPLAQGTVSLFGGDPGHEWEEKLATVDSTKAIAPMKDVMSHFYAKYPEIEAVQISTYKLEKSGYYMIHPASFVGLKNYKGYVHCIDKYTGKEITLPEKVRLHEEIENVWWMLHMGTWMGLWSKTLTFTAAIIATSLPITGFIIWWGKRRKKPKKKSTRQYALENSEV
jgi:uncharacterized iron-regulated membrane protein